jgi:Spy/CpxP family protein refolding chaperone
VQRLSLSFTFALSVAAIACGHTHPANGPGGGSAAQPADEAAEADHHVHQRAGIALYIEISLETLEPTQLQADALKKIRRELHDKMLPAHNAEKAIIRGLATGIKAGALDRAQLDAALAELKTAAAGIHDAVAVSLNELHSTLDAEQRKKLVAQVERHFRIWHKAHPHERAEPDKTGGHLARLANQLALTDQQVGAIRASFDKSMADLPAFDRAKAKEHVKAFAAAFESEQFDARAILPDNSDMATWGITRTVRFYEAVLPTLTADQRGKLAELVRHHST